MSKTQGDALKMETSILKVMEGILCSSLSKIFEQDGRNEKLNNIIFSCIIKGENKGEDDDTIIKNLKETLQKMFLDKVKEILTKNRDYFVNIVANEVVAYANLVDENVKKT